MAAATLRADGARRARSDDDDEDDDELSTDDEEDEGPEIGVTVEIVGLSLYTHHGVTAAEREIGQRLVLDLRFDVGEPDALITDRVEDTVDYGEVCQVIALVAQQRSYKTLERLCAVIADRLPRSSAPRASGSRRPSPSRRSRSRSRRSRSRCGGKSVLEYSK